MKLSEWRETRIDGGGSSTVLKGGAAGGDRSEKIVEAGNNGVELVPVWGCSSVVVAKWELRSTRVSRATGHGCVVG